MSDGMEIYIEGSPAEHRVAHLGDQGQMIALDIFRMTRPCLAGGIYLGRVTTFDKRLGAAFVDLGIGVPALLPKARGISEGDAILLQISRDSHDDKGPAVTRQITLWGRYLACQPGRGGGLQSARGLGQGRRRSQTLAMAEKVLRDPTDILLRAPASAVAPETFAAEAETLRGCWDRILSESKSLQAPACLLPAPGILQQTLRDAPPEARIALDDRLDHAEAVSLSAEYYPDLNEGIVFYREAIPMFEALGISDILETALSSEVEIRGGGRLTIEETRALTAIDVDIGGSEAGAPQKEEAIHRLNRRAAEEAARQIQLRRLGGLIVIDFAGFKNRGRMKALLDILRSRLKGGNVHSDVLGISAAGLVEITRQRAGPSLAELCHGTREAPIPAPDAEAANALRQVLRLTGSGKPVLHLSNAAIRHLNGPMKPARDSTEKRLGQKLILEKGASQPVVRLEK